LTCNDIFNIDGTGVGSRFGCVHPDYVCSIRIVNDILWDNGGYGRDVEIVSGHASRGTSQVCDVYTVSTSVEQVSVNINKLKGDVVLVTSKPLVEASKTRRSIVCSARSIRIRSNDLDRRQVGWVDNNTINTDHKTEVLSSSISGLSGSVADGVVCKRVAALGKETVSSGSCSSNSD
jgi:hypothetical protein